MKQKSEKSDLLLYPLAIGAQPFSYGQQFWERKDGSQPCGSTLAFHATNWICVNSKIPQLSYSYGTQILRGIGPKSLSAMLFEFFNESEGYNGYCKYCTVLMQTDNACLYSRLGLTSLRVTLGFSLLISSQRFLMSVLKILEVLLLRYFGLFQSLSGLLSI